MYQYVAYIPKEGFASAVLTTKTSITVQHFVILQKASSRCENFENDVSEAAVMSTGVSNNHFSTKNAACDGAHKVGTCRLYDVTRRMWYYLYTETFDGPSTDQICYRGIYYGMTIGMPYQKQQQSYKNHDSLTILINCSNLFLTFLHEKIFR